MAVTKLTKSLRDVIISNAMKGAYQDVEDKINADWTALSMRFYEKMVPKEVQEIAAKLPVGFCAQVTDAHVYVRKSEVSGGNSVRLRFGDKELRVPVNWLYKIDVVDADLFDEVDKFKARSDDLAKLRAELREKVYQVVYSVSSIQRLMEVWPESKEFMPSNFFSPKKNLPMIAVGDLNDLLFKAVGKPAQATSIAA